MQSDIEKVKFKPGLPWEIEIVPIADTVIKHQQSIIHPHRPEFYHIFWIQRGVAKYLIDFEPIIVRPDCFLFVNKDRVQSIDDRSKHDGKLLLFTDSFFANNEADTKYLHSSILFNDLLDIPIVNVKAHKPLRDIFAAIEKELEEENDMYHYGLLHNLLHNLLLLAERERRNQGFTDIGKGADLDYTVLFKDLLETQFKSLKSVSGYASQLNVSEKRLAHATSKTLGKSPKAIINERIMLETKRLLIHTNRSIKQIGYDLGFEEPTNFIKYFRKHTDKTPINFKECYFHR